MGGPWLGGPLPHGSGPVLPGPLPRGSGPAVRSWVGPLGGTLGGVVVDLCLPFPEPFGSQPVAFFQGPQYPFGGPPWPFGALPFGTFYWPSVPSRLPECQSPAPPSPFSSSLLSFGFETFPNSTIICSSLLCLELRKLVWARSLLLLFQLHTKNLLGFHTPNGT